MAHASVCRAKMRVVSNLVLLCFASTANAGAVELNKGTFATEVKQSGKNAFVKFLAPWCVCVCVFVLLFLL